MSYSDDYKDKQRAAFVQRHGPKTPPELSMANLVYNIARANKAEHELSELKGALDVLKGALR